MIKKAEPSLEINSLKPVLEDRALMALIKNRYVPFSFLIKRVHRKLTNENGIQVMQALKALSHGNHPGAGIVGVQDLDVHFSMVSEVLHVGGGRQAQRGGHTVLDEIGLQEIRDALSPISRLAGRTFGVKHYDRLKKQYDLYERVLRECERCTNLVEARGRVGVNDADWQTLKGLMGRFGLVRDIVYAKPILLEGALVREIEQRHLGERVEDVVPRLLRNELGTAAPA